MLNIKHTAKRLTAKRRLAVTAAQFHACRLGLENLSETIEIRFTRDMLRDTGEFANCGLDDGVLALNIDDGLDHHLMQTTIAHEMVHAKQWLRGELGLTKNNAFLWKGKRVKSNTPYHELPWEREAMAAEIIMSHEFAHFLETCDTM